MSETLKVARTSQSSEMDKYFSFVQGLDEF